MEEHGTTPTLKILGLPTEDSNKAADTPVVEMILLSGANLACLVAMYWRKRLWATHFLPEQFVSISMGALLGGVTKAFHYDDLSETILYNFSSLFFNFLLPAIIFSNAFSIKNKSFVRNLSGILCYSLFGTVFSTVFIGFGVYFAFQSGLIPAFAPDEKGEQDDHLLLVEHATHPGNVFMPLVDCLILGSQMSAVDPGAVLTVLPASVDRQIYSFLFGESVLNSAVAVVLYNGFRMYHAVLVDRGDMNAIVWDDVNKLVYRFMAVTFLSMVGGVIIGLLSALTLKRVVDFRESPGREQAIMLLFAYLSYLLPREIGLSPVVALFFCGTTMTHYTFYNISTMSQIATSSWFKTIGHVAETFVFVFLGASLFSVSKGEWHFELIVILIVLCLISRVLQITILSNIINVFKFVQSHRASWSQWFPCRAFDACFWHLCLRKDELSDLEPEGRRRQRAAPSFRTIPNYISWRAQIFLSLSGLRGAVAFALALHSPVLNREGQMLTTTISVVLFTYIFQGSSLHYIAKRLGLVADDDNLLQFFQNQRQKNINNFKSPYDILHLGMSPNTVHQSANSNFQEGNLMGSLSLNDFEGEHRYGTFTQAWRRFDEAIMKPVFGGRARTTFAPALSVAIDERTPLFHENSLEEKEVVL